MDKIVETGFVEATLTPGYLPLYVKLTCNKCGDTREIRVSFLQVDGRLLTCPSDTLTHFYIDRVRTGWFLFHDQWYCNKHEPAVVDRSNSG